MVDIKVRGRLNDRSSVELLSNLQRLNDGARLDFQFSNTDPNDIKILDGLSSQCEAKRRRQNLVEGIKLGGVISLGFMLLSIWGFVL